MAVNYVLYNRDAENHKFTKSQSTYDSETEETEFENVQGLEEVTQEIECDDNQLPECTLNTLITDEPEKSHEVKVDEGSVANPRQWLKNLMHLAVKCYHLLEMVHFVSPVWIFHPYMSHRTLKGTQPFNKPQDNLP